MASLRPKKDALYAQKVIQGSKSDTRDLVAGAEQCGVSPPMTASSMLAPSLINKQPINGLFLTHHPPFAALPALGM